MWRPIQIWGGQVCAGRAVRAGDSPSRPPGLGLGFTVHASTRAAGARPPILFSFYLVFYFTL